MTRLALNATLSCAALVTLGIPSGAVAQSLTDLPLPALTLSAVTSAEDPEPLKTDASEGWRFEFNSWLWMVGFTGDIGARGRTADVDANFGDVLDASDSVFALSGRIELGFGKIAAFADGVYSDLGFDDQTGPLGLSDIDVTLEQGLIDFGLMYRIGDWEPHGAAEANPRNITLDLYAGARYNSLELTVSPANIDERSTSRDWFDPIVGAKLGLPLSERWHLKLNGDVGGFGVESDFTWSATAVFGYDFDLFGLPATILAGYRAIGWDYSDGSGNDEFVFDITQHGPILGLSIRF